MSSKMAQTSLIIVSLDIDEARRPRARRLADAIAFDGHFIRGKVANLSHDIRFQWMDRTINVELKDFSFDGQSDYVASVINNSEGRLYQQVLLARELEDPFIIVVLGEDSDVASAIARSVAAMGFRSQEAEDRIIEYTHMLEIFEANCLGCNIQVWRMKDNPFGRLLQRVRKIMQGGDFFSFRPRPAEGERESAALSMIIGNGMGRARSRAILERFHLTLQPRGQETCLCDCPGIGPRMATVIQEALGLPDEMMARPRSTKAIGALAKTDAVIDPVREKQKPLEKPGLDLSINKMINPANLAKKIQGDIFAGECDQGSCAGRSRGEAY